ncbi:MAG: hypothetical protein D8M54_11520 [Chloroflexi bacterium]|nr:hypothetical protein [Chloroflexota bacterium]
MRECFLLFSFIAGGGCFKNKETGWRTGCVKARGGEAVVPELLLSFFINQEVLRFSLNASTGFIV